MSDETVRIDYTNHRGERSIRTVTPLLISEWSRGASEPEWHLGAVEPGDETLRRFAMKDIHAWIPPGVDPRLPRAREAADVLIRFVKMHHSGFDKIGQCLDTIDTMGRPDTTAEEKESALLIIHGLLYGEGK